MSHLFLIFSSPSNPRCGLQGPLDPWNQVAANPRNRPCWLGAPDWSTYFGNQPAGAMLQELGSLVASATYLWDLRSFLLPWGRSLPSITRKVKHVGLETMCLCLILNPRPRDPYGNVGYVSTGSATLVTVALEPVPGGNHRCLFFPATEMHPTKTLNKMGSHLYQQMMFRKKYGKLCIFPPYA